MHARRGCFELEGVEFFWELRKHDETGHYVSITENGVRHEQVWHIMVQIRRIAWRLALGGPTFFFDILVPRVPMESTKGEEAWLALFYHPWVAPIHKLIQRAHRVARFSSVVREADGAGANLRVIAQEDVVWTRERRRGLRIFTQCYSHQNNHVQGDIIADEALKGKHLMGMMYAGSLLMRMSPFWMQLHRALPRVIDALLVVQTYGEPDPGQMRRNRLLMALHLAGVKLSRKSRQSFMTLVEGFLAFCPGPLANRIQQSSERLFKFSVITPL